jgi:hypothetical protein
VEILLMHEDDPLDQNENPMIMFFKAIINSIQLQLNHSSLAIQVTRLAAVSAANPAAKRVRFLK